MSPGRAAAVTTVLTVALAAVVAAVSAAGAAAAPAAVPAPTYLALTVTVAGGHATHVTLRCDPPRGTHPRAAAACTAIAGAGGDLTALPARTDVLCAAQYQPATAAAAGTWRGRPVRYRRTYSNSCALGVATGPVFRF